MGLRALLVGFWIFVAAAAPAFAAEPSREEPPPETEQSKPQLWTYETEFLKLVYYSSDHAYLVPHLARSFENSLAFHRRLFDYTPSEKIVVLLHDFGDFGHGGTSTVPWNYITIGIEPFDYVYETMPTNERMNWLMHHELVHVVATDKGARFDNVSRRLFTGKVAPTTENPISMFYSYLTSPRWYSPRWYHEGIAVFLETWMAGGLGRALGGYDEMVFRAMVEEDRHFYDVVGLESEGTTIDFQVGQNSYLYGTRFVTWLGLQYGPDKLVDWFDRDPGSRRYFAKQFEEVYGIPLHQAWRSWIEHEHEWQRDNLERIREYAVTEDRPLLARPLGSISRPWIDTERRRVLAAVNYPAHPAHLASIGLDDGEETRLGDVLGPSLYYVSSLAWDPAGRKLFYTTDNTRGWRDLRELDVDSGARRVVLRNVRAGDLVVHPVDHSIWATQHHNGLTSIIRIPPPYESWETLLTLDYGKDVFDLDLAPDGATLSAGLVEIDGRQRLVAMKTADVQQGLGSYRVLHEFEDNAPQNFVFSPDGRYLFGSSYYTGVSNLFRYELASGEMKALTNATTGYFRPTPLNDHELLALRYTTEGFLPVVLPIEVREDLNAVRYLGQEVVEEHPVVTTWNAGSPLRIDLDGAKRFEGDYHGLKRFRLASVYPVVEGYKDTEVYGARMSFSDPVGLHSLDLTAGWSPAEAEGEEQYHVNAAYRHWPWRVRAGHNMSDFYDLFGPTKTSRKGTFFSAGYENYLINQRPRTLTYDLSASAWTGLETLPEFQNVAANVESYQSARASLDYSHLRRTIGAVDFEKGLGWQLGLVNNHVDSELLSRLHANVDFGVQTGIDHSSLWLRGSAGWSFGDEDNPFSNFYFGGFGNNWIDHLEARRYRELDSFPGVELNDIEANRYGKLMLEWTLPPIRYQHAGSPGFFLNWTQFMLFTSGIVANTGDLDLPRREVLDAGVQADFRLVLFSTLESTLSIGYARAFEEGRDTEHEFMASLKLLR